MAPMNIPTPCYKTKWRGQSQGSKFTREQQYPSEPTWGIGQGASEEPLRRREGHRAAFNGLEQGWATAGTRAELGTRARKFGTRANPRKRNPFFQRK